MTAGRSKGPGKTAKKVRTKPGRPSVFKPEYSEQAYHLALLGATDSGIARALGVSDRTVDGWKTAHPEFLRSLKAGKEEADATVAKSLYQRALGYSHPAVKIITVADGNNQGSHVEQVPYTEHYPPDTTACIFWLKNRQREQWRDKMDHEVRVDSERLKSMSDEELAAIVAGKG